MSNIQINTKKLSGGMYGLHLCMKAQTNGLRWQWSFDDTKNLCYSETATNINIECSKQTWKIIGFQPYNIFEFVIDEENKGKTPEDLLRNPIKTNVILQSPPINQRECMLARFKGDLHF